MLSGAQNGRISGVKDLVGLIRKLYKCMQEWIF